MAVFGSSVIRPGAPEWSEAQQLGRLLGERGFDVATGGYGGAMEAVSQGASERGVNVIGVTAPVLFPQRPGANSYVTHERPAASLTARIEEMLTLSVGAVTLPGSIGTLTEFMVAWNELFIRAMADKPRFPVVAVGAMWGRLIPRIADELDTDLSLVTLASSVDDAVVHIQRQLG